MKDKTRIHLISKVDGQLLYEYLDDLENQTASSKQMKEKVKEAVDKYISQKEGS